MTLRRGVACIGVTLLLLSSHRLLVAASSTPAPYVGWKVHLADVCPEHEDMRTKGLVKEGAFGLIAIALAQVVIPKLIGAGISFLEKEGKPLEVTVSMRTADEFYAVQGEELTSRFRCIIVAHGRFGGNVPQAASPGMKRLGLEEPPEFYVELALWYSTDKAHMRLVPAVVDIKKPLSSSFFTKTRDVAFRISLVDDGGEILMDVGLKNVVPPVLLAGSALRDVSSQWVRLPVAAKTSAKPATLGAVTVTATVVEGRGGSDLLLELAKATKENQGKIVEEIGKILKDALGGK